MEKKLEECQFNTCHECVLSFVCLQETEELKNDKFKTYRLWKKS